jgi:hypothetical protein
MTGLGVAPGRIGLDQPSPTQCGANAGAPQGLLSDPPLLDRLRWREGIRPETMISNDRGLIGRIAEAEPVGPVE